MTGVTVLPAEAKGMISFKADLSGSGVEYALKKATGLPVPGSLQVSAAGDTAALWMAPDELLVLCPRDAVSQTLGKLSSSMGEAHFLAVDVSDARVGFKLAGEDAVIRAVLARLTPADLHPGTVLPGQVRRTRLGQVAAAIWMKAGEAEVLVFRSVADYAAGVLANAAASPAVGHF
ncbi:MAG: sarcosine oxidase subunit gamma family protein [Pseudomonadota bacterium]